jgi:prophage regulatory protein
MKAYTEARNVASDYKILRLPQVKLQTGLSRSSIYLRIAEDKFPRQIYLGGGRAVGWLATDIDNWIKQQLAQSRTSD